MVDAPPTPPLDGSIYVLPGFVDFQAQHNPQRAWGVFPSPSGNGTVSVSFKEFADATHRIAHALRPLSQHSGQPTGAGREVVAVLINCDTILYCALMSGMVRAGFVPFPLSPRNSAPAVISMLEKTSCHRVVANWALNPLINAINVELSMREQQYPLEISELPDLYDIFPTLLGKMEGREATGTLSDVLPYPDVVSSRPIDEVVLYLHSSGSTGFPKPIPQTHRTIIEWCHTDVFTKTRQWGCLTASMALPTFHTMGMYQHIYSPLVTGRPVALFTPQARPQGHPGHQTSPVVPTPQGTIEVAKRLGCTSVLVVPSFIEEWAQSEENVQYLASMKFVIFAGGPLSDRNGDKLTAAGTKLYSIYGATEFGAPSSLVTAGERIPWHSDDLRVHSTGHQEKQDEIEDVKAPEDWPWITFSQRMKPRWEPEGDGSYELQVLTCETHHPSVENLPDVRGYATNDLWIPHPTKKGLWRIAGRKDDVIVLGSGEKVVPVQQEGLITSSAMVSGVVMFGRGRSQCGVLIEPHPAYAVEDSSDEAALIKFRNLIWPVIEEANHIAPTFARIFKEMIIVTNPKRPFPRAAKGTIVRKQVLLLYESDIEKLYQTVDDSTNANGIAPPATWSVENVERWLMQHSAAIHDSSLVNPNIDIFEQGFDSLHVTFLRNKIIGALRNAEDPALQNASTHIAQNFVFQHPTLHELAAAISALAGPDAEDDNTANSTANTADAITAMLEKYSAGLPGSASPSKGGHGSSNELVVLLTGSTGNVGSHMLAALLVESRVRKVYTLNRPSTGAVSEVDRQRVAFEARNLPVELLIRERWVPLSGDVGAEMFGLEQAVYEEISNTVTHVIHNAWKVDFNQSLRSFEPLVAGTRRLIDACYTFSQPVTLLFSSSEAVTLGWDKAFGPIPEEPLQDPRIASATGYGASKYITENLLAKASNTHLQTVTLRIGQVCGAKTTGVWSTREWVPILVKSSLALGALPNGDEPITWIPMDAVAGASVDLVVKPDRLPCLLNVVHPQAVSWNSVFEKINDHLPRSLPLIPATEWLAKLEKLSANPTAKDLERIPALKLLDFFRGTFSPGGRPETQSTSGAKFSTSNLVEYSPTVQNMGPVGNEHAKSWAAYWKSQGFFDEI